VLKVFSLPTDERLRVLISSLGIGTAARGGDLNALLRRANPALTTSRRVLDTFNRQRAQIADAIGQTDRVLGRVGAQRRDVRTFVGRAAATARTTAAHRVQLGQAIDRLPGMLDQVRPGLRSLDRAATDATPLLDALHSAAPELQKATRTLPAFARAGSPALRALSQVTHDNRAVLRRARPTASRLAGASQQLGPLAGQVDDLLVSLRQTGGVEGTMRILYTLAVLTSTYDDTSHIINFIANVAPNCLIAEQAGTDSPGCSHKWSAPGHGTIPVNEPSCGPQKPEDLWRNHRCPLAVPVGTAPGRSAPRKPLLPLPAKAAPPQMPAAGAPKAPAKPSVPAPPVDIPGLLDKLLGAAGQPPAAREDRNVTTLLDFLLKP
jgi:ABC-type transporter Mla subunit MlaD